MNDLPVGRSVDETLRLLQAFQYTDKHGEVCPAGWKPGADTVGSSLIDKRIQLIFVDFVLQIIPDPEKKQQYFNKVNKEDL